MSDNGPQFTSREFQQYLPSNGIKHITGAPYHPDTNGAAENAVKSGKLALLKAKDNNTASLHFVLNQFLFHYRNTDHCITNISPAQMLFGRSLRSQFDLLRPRVTDRVANKQGNQKQNFPGCRNLEFKINKLVLVRDFRNQKPFWCPAVILRLLAKINSRLYEVETKLEKLIWRRHLDDILKFNAADTNVVKNKTVAFVPREQIINNTSEIARRDSIAIEPLITRLSLAIILLLVKIVSFC